MTATYNYVATRLPGCLAALIAEYFGQSTNAYVMARLGQWEDCTNLLCSENDKYELGELIISRVFRGACRGGHIEIVNYLIDEYHHGCGGIYGRDEGLKTWGPGLYEACSGGHIAIAKLALSRGATNINSCMYTACIYNQIEAAKLMIAHGATNFNDCMFGAIHHGNFDVVKLMIAHGATDLYEGFIDASTAGFDEIANFISVKRWEAYRQFNE